MSATGRKLTYRTMVCYVLGPNPNRDGLFADGSLKRSGKAMHYIIINIAPIAVATIIGLLILWLGFRQQLRGAAFAIAALALFWLAAILAGALILAPVDADAWTIALGTAFIIWVGFVLPVLSIALPLRGASLTRALSDAAWWLAIMLAQAAALHSVGLIRPSSPAAASVGANLPHHDLAA